MHIYLFNAAFRLKWTLAVPGHNKVAEMIMIPILRKQLNAVKSYSLLLFEKLSLKKSRIMIQNNNLNEFKKKHLPFYQVHRIINAV